MIHNFLTETGTSPNTSRKYIVEQLNEGSLDHSQKYLSYAVSNASSVKTNQHQQVKDERDGNPYLDPHSQMNAESSYKERHIDSNETGVVSSINESALQNLRDTYILNKTREE